MRVRPTDIGGRVVEGDTPFGNFRVEWDAAGKLVSEQMTLRSPEQAPVRQSVKRQDAPSKKPKKRIIDGPGTWLAHLIRAITFGRVRPCTSCKSRARKLDRLGWRGVLTLGLWK